MSYTRAELKAFTRKRIKFVDESNDKFFVRVEEYVYKKIKKLIKSDNPRSLVIKINSEKIKRRLANPNMTADPCSYIGDTSSFLGLFAHSIYKVCDSLKMKVEVRRETKDQALLLLKFAISFGDDDSVFDSSSESEADQKNEF